MDPEFFVCFVQTEVEKLLRCPQLNKRGSVGLENVMYALQGSTGQYPDSLTLLHS